MRYYSLLDNNDFVIDIKKYEVGQQPTNAVEALPINNEFKPKYDRVNNIIVEGALNSEIVDYNTDKYNSIIIDIYTKLSIRALSSSMGKYGTYEYLQVQRDEYDRKYKLAKGEITDIYLENAIVKEMERDFTEAMLDTLLTSYGITPSGDRRNKMNQLIMFRYEYASDRLNRFLGFVTDFRTKCITWIETEEWSKLDQAISLAESVPETLEMTDAENLYNQFNSI